MKEQVTFPDPAERLKTGLLKGRPLPPKTWALTGAKGRPPQLIRSLLMAPGELEQHNLHLAEKYAAMERDDAVAELTDCGDAQVVLAAYGSSARIAKGALQILRRQGVKAGLFRPVTL